MSHKTIHKTAECCQKCQHAGVDGGCKIYHLKCAAWLSWFRKEWSRIRKAAEIVKENRERKSSK